MLTDIVLSKVPFPHGKNETIIMRVEDPTKVTLEFNICFYRKTNHNMPQVYNGWK